MKKLALLVSAALFFSVTVMAQDSTSFSDYYGKYKFAEGSPVSEVEIVWQDNAIGISSDMGTSAIAKTGIDSFSMDYMNGVIIFKRDSATQKINGLTILVSGMEMQATRQEAVATGTSHIKLFMKKEEPLASR